MTFGGKDDSSEEEEEEEEDIVSIGKFYRSASWNILLDYATSIVKHKKKLILPATSFFHGRV